MKHLIKFTLAVAMLCAGFSAHAQFYTYRSFVNGYNLFVGSGTGAAATNTFTLYGGTNQANSVGYNNYVYGGNYPGGLNANIGTNTILGSPSAFGLYTNVNAVVDADIWPDNNSDTPTSLALFISASPINGYLPSNGAAQNTTNAYTLTFQSVVSVPINIPPGSSSYLNNPGSGTITNTVLCTNALTASFTVTNGQYNTILPLTSTLLNGASKLRLVSIAEIQTNSLVYWTNQIVSSLLTNGVWQATTNYVAQTNAGAIYLNIGVTGFPPFHSP